MSARRGTGEAQSLRGSEPRWTGHFGTSVSAGSGLGQEEPHGIAAHLFVRQGDGGEAGAQIGGEFVIVEGDDGDVVRDRQAGLAERLIGTEGQPVVQAEQRPWPAAGAAGA